MTCCSQSKIQKFYSCSRNRRQLICMFPYYSIEMHVSPSGSVHPRAIVTTWKWGARDAFRWGERLDTISVFLCWSCTAPFLLICLIGSAGAVWLFPMSPSSHQWLSYLLPYSSVFSPFAREILAWEFMIWEEKRLSSFYWQGQLSELLAVCSVCSHCHFPLSRAVVWDSGGN